MILVTEHASNGYLKDYWENVKDKSVLTWEKRLKICLDVAHALKYIECEMGVGMLKNVYFISSQDIVLDENWGAKIKFDEHHLGKDNLLIRIDVRCLGEFLLVVLFGKRTYTDFCDKVFDWSIETYLPKYINDGQIYSMLDSTIKNDSGACFASLNKFIEIASECVLKPDDQKPTMNVIVNELQQEEKKISSNQFPSVEICDFSSPYLLQKEYVDSEDKDAGNDVHKITFVLFYPSKKRFIILLFETS
ncbi:probable serine/threonine-protein kinase PBL28 [Rutidosis leptorrhynchoides]|uniref:probable serine/threonine-protein kinase PBL28 n=1 Tax=Rutidosis leptorrhynchoides TaxID=125765 RepID=UPI003A99D2F5